MQFFFFYNTDVFKIVCWFNVFEIFLSPLKIFRGCRSFTSSLMFRCWKSFLILSTQKVFLLPHFCFTFWRYSANAFFTGVFLSSLRRQPSNDNLLLFTRLLHFSASIVSYNSLPFIVFSYLTPMTWQSSFCSKESILSSMVFVVVHNSPLYRKYSEHKLWKDSVLFWWLLFATLVSFLVCSWYWWRGLSYGWCLNLCP